jgi:carboxyl-terminal processing protease
MPDVIIEQELPEELKPKRPERPRGEASLRGHLKGEDKKEESGSSAYVPKEPEKDTQLQYALKLMRGEIPEPTLTPREDEADKSAAEKSGAAKKETAPAAKK